MRSFTFMMLKLLDFFNFASASIFSTLPMKLDFKDAEEL